MQNRRGKIFQPSYTKYLVFSDQTMDLKVLDYKDNNDDIFQRCFIMNH